MIVFRLADKLGLSYTKEHSFGDKSHPADFTCLHVGFLRIIRPIKEEAFSKYFRMYLGDDYEWHHKVRKEVKKQRSKQEAYYRERNGEQIEDYQKRNRELQDLVYRLKEDVRALVRSSVVIENVNLNELSNEIPNISSITSSNGIANSTADDYANDEANAIANSLANTFANTDANDLSNAKANADPITKANTDANAKANDVPIGVANTDVNDSPDKVSIEAATVVPSDAVNDLPMQQPYGSV